MVKILLEIRNKILREVDKLEGELVSFLQDMVRIPSISIPGEYEEIKNCIVKWWKKKFDLSIHVIETPLEFLKQYGLEKPRFSIIAEFGNRNKDKTLILNAHIDTQPVEHKKEWSVDPFSGTLKEGKVFGRGTCDCKGMVAAWTGAVVALKRAGLDLNGKILLTATPDEEIGGKTGAGYIVQKGLIEGDMAIVEGRAYYVARAINGVIWLRIKTKGRSFQAPRMEEGINAIEKMHKVISALYEFNKALRQRKSEIAGCRCNALSVNTIRGGVSQGVVPAACEIDVFFRIIPETGSVNGINRIKRLLEMKIDQLRKEDRELEVEMEWKLTREAPEPTPEDAEINQVLLKNIKAITGKKLEVKGSPGFTDMFYFQKAGIKSTQWGVARPENNIHGIDENVKVKDVLIAAKVVALTALDLLSTPREL